jgi:hypothetical protein
LATQSRLGYYTSGNLGLIVLILAGLRLLERI